MNVTLVCKQCGKTARRPLIDVSGCHGRRELPTELALCPDGHGRMEREDGVDDSWFWKTRDANADG